VSPRELQMMRDGLYQRLTDVERNENIFVRDDDPVEHRCRAYGCPVIEVSEGGRISTSWATREDVLRCCS